MHFGCVPFCAVRRVGRKLSSLVAAKRLQGATLTIKLWSSLADGQKQISIRLRGLSLRFPEGLSWCVWQRGPIRRRVVVISLVLVCVGACHKGSNYECCKSCWFYRVMIRHLLWIGRCYMYVDSSWSYVRTALGCSDGKGMSTVTTNRHTHRSIISNTADCLKFKVQRAFALGRRRQFRSGGFGLRLGLCV